MLYTARTSEAPLETVSVIDLIGDMLPLVVAWAAGLVLSIVALAMVAQGRRANSLVLPGGLGLSVLALWAYGSWQRWGLDALGASEALTATQASALASFVGWMALTGHAGLVGMALSARAARGASWRASGGLGVAAGALLAIGLIVLGGVLNGMWVMAIARGLGYAFVGGLLVLVCVADGEEVLRSDLRVGGAWILFLTLVVGEIGYRGLTLFMALNEVAVAGAEIRVELITELHRIVGLEVPWQLAGAGVAAAMAVAVTVREGRREGQGASAWLGLVWLLLALLAAVSSEPSLEQLIGIAGGLP